MRHGQSVFNVEARVPGQSNPPLTTLGLEQARRAAEQLGGCGAVRLISSDLGRARRTAQVIGEALGLPVETDVALREQCAGSMEGRFYRELHPEDPPPNMHLHDVRWGGGESVVDVYRRLQGFFDRLAGETPGTTILVSHGHTIQIAEALLRGDGPYDIEWRELPNGGIVQASAPLSFERRSLGA